jgi:hypothetical protein
VIAPFPRLHVRLSMIASGEMTGFAQHQWAARR